MVASYTTNRLATSRIRRLKKCTINHIETAVIWKNRQQKGEENASEEKEA